MTDYTDTDPDHNSWYEDYYSDVYANPKKLGVETVGTLNLEMQSYEFDMLLVSRDPETGKFYVLHDSGCSCPSPFETYKTRESLGEPLDARTAAARVQARAAEAANNPYNYDDYRPDASELVAKILSY
jgi:hypothetical protein